MEKMSHWLGGMKNNKDDCAKEKCCFLYSSSEEFKLDLKKTPTDTDAFS